ncbi:hypothetical protein DWW69_00480 [Bacteroides sp. AF16-49]|nr:hypothetical protein DWW69_00480 [Bacteroides sp. AF16-49]
MTQINRRIMDNTTQQKTITLEEIGKRKEALRLQIEKQRSVIISSVKKTFAPTPTEKAAHPIMQSFNTGLAIFDGVMTGIKIMRRVKAFLKRMK